ncbi:SWIM zinc finger family protein [Rhodovulum adriaticum]|uniref:SWIM zinc finger protein n=1 Tax=Rhodovulum adriaticum TaxID=35804 RepID=A0A4R2NPC0_RHOAD|nr:SWIM zinc finger family protein [Rhodovulum adriaticum]TCP23271.1 SWIM zinc finger protein [Rhodovulum adriaticum]
MTQFPCLNFDVVSSSTGEIYHVQIARTENNLTCTCSCPAGQNNTACKHRLGLLLGKPEGVVGGDLDRIETIPSMLEGTDVDEALGELAALEGEKARIAKSITAAKKKLARVLSN